MKAWNIELDKIRKIVNTVSKEKYENNLILDEGGFHSPPKKVGKAISFTLRVNSSKEPGHTITHSGKRWVSACWHCHRDVMIAMFKYNPNIRIKSAIADYKGKEDFKFKFPATAYINVGSMMQPRNMEDGCECL